MKRQIASLKQQGGRAITGFEMLVLNQLSSIATGDDHPGDLRCQIQPAQSRVASGHCTCATAHITSPTPALLPWFEKHKCFSPDGSVGFKVDCVISMTDAPAFAWALACMLSNFDDVRRRRLRMAGMGARTRFPS